MWGADAEVLGDLQETGLVRVIIPLEGGNYFSSTTMGIFFRLCCTADWFGLEAEGLCLGGGGQRQGPEQGERMGGQIGPLIDSGDEG